MAAGFSGVDVLFPRVPASSDSDKHKKRLNRNFCDNNKIISVPSWTVANFWWNVRKPSSVQQFHSQSPERTRADGIGLLEWLTSADGHGPRYFDAPIFRARGLCGAANPSVGSAGRITE